MYCKRYFSTPPNFQPKRNFSSCLVVAEHDNKKLSTGTLNTLTAAKQLSSDITVLIAGHFAGNNNVAKQVAKSGVKKVLVADKDTYKNFLPERYVKNFKTG